MTRNVLIVEDDPMARKLFEIILESSGRYHLEASIESASLDDLRKVLPAPAALAVYERFHPADTDEKKS